MESEFQTGCQEQWSSHSVPQGVFSIVRRGGLSQPNFRVGPGRRLLDLATFIVYGIYCTRCFTNLGVPETSIVSCNNGVASSNDVFRRQSESLHTGAETRSTLCYWEPRKSTLRRDVSQVSQTKYGSMSSTSRMRSLPRVNRGPAKESGYKQLYLSDIHWIAPVSSICESAGTELALGASTIVTTSY